MSDSRSDSSTGEFFIRSISWSLLRSTSVSLLTDERAQQIKLGMIAMYANNLLGTLSEQHYSTFEFFLQTHYSSDPTPDEVQEMLDQEVYKYTQIINFLEGMESFLRNNDSINSAHEKSGMMLSEILKSTEKVKVGRSFYQIETKEETKRFLKKIDRDIKATNTIEALREFVTKELSKFHKYTADEAKKLEETAEPLLIPTSPAKTINDISFRSPQAHGLISARTEEQLRYSENKLKVADSYILTSEDKNDLLEHLLSKNFSYENSRLVAIVIKSGAFVTEEDRKQVEHCLESLKKNEETRLVKAGSKEWVQEANAGLLQVAKYLNEEAKKNTDNLQKKMIHEKFVAVKAALKNINSEKAVIGETLENLKKNTTISQKRGSLPSTTFKKLKNIKPKFTFLTPVAENNQIATVNLATHCIKLRQECAKREQERESCINLTIGLLESVESHLKARLDKAWLSSNKEILNQRLVAIQSAKTAVLGFASPESSDDFSNRVSSDDLSTVNLTDSPQQTVERILEELISKDCIKQHRLWRPFGVGGKTETSKLLEATQAIVAPVA